MIPYKHNTLLLKTQGLHLEYGYARQAEILSFVGIENIPTNPDTMVGELRCNPLEPCARYKEVLALKSKYRTQYGDNQLEQDYKNMLEKLRGYNEYKNL